MKRKNVAIPPRLEAKKAPRICPTVSSSRPVASAVANTDSESSDDPDGDTFGFNDDDNDQKEYEEKGDEEEGEDFDDEGGDNEDDDEPLPEYVILESQNSKRKLKATPSSSASAFASNADDDSLPAELVCSHMDYLHPVLAEQDERQQRTIRVSRREEGFAIAKHLCLVVVASDTTNKAVKKKNRRVLEAESCKTVSGRIHSALSSLTEHGRMPHAPLDAARLVFWLAQRRLEGYNPVTGASASAVAAKQPVDTKDAECRYFPKLPPIPLKADEIKPYHTRLRTIALRKAPVLTREEMVDADEYRVDAGDGRVFVVRPHTKVPIVGIPNGAGNLAALESEWRPIMRKETRRISKAISTRKSYVAKKAAREAGRQHAVPAKKQPQAATRSSTDRLASVAAAAAAAPSSLLVRSRPNTAEGVYTGDDGEAKERKRATRKESKRKHEETNRHLLEDDEALPDTRSFQLGEVLRVHGPPSVVPNIGKTASRDDCLWVVADFLVHPIRAAAKNGISCPKNAYHFAIDKSDPECYIRLLYYVRAVCRMETALRHFSRVSVWDIASRVSTADPSSYQDPDEPQVVASLHRGLPPFLACATFTMIPPAAAPTYD